MKTVHNAVATFIRLWNGSQRHSWSVTYSKIYLYMMCFFPTHIFSIVRVCFACAAALLSFAMPRLFFQRVPSCKRTIRQSSRCSLLLFRKRPRKNGANYELNASQQRRTYQQRNEWLFPFDGGKSSFPGNKLPANVNCKHEYAQSNSTWPFLISPLEITFFRVEWWFTHWSFASESDIGNRAVVAISSGRKKFASTALIIFAWLESLIRISIKFDFNVNLIRNFLFFKHTRTSRNYLLSIWRLAILFPWESFNVMKKKCVVFNVDVKINILAKSNNHATKRQSHISRLLQRWKVRKLSRLIDFIFHPLANR